MDKNSFIIKLDSFNQGASPTLHLDSLSQIGGAGNYSVATNVDVTVPGILTQGPGLATLTAGTEAGAITELVNYIIDVPVATDTTYGIAATKLHQISSTAVTNAGIWPHAITNATAGNSVIEFQGKLYYFYNKVSGADCGQYDLATTFDDDYFSTVPTGKASLQSAPHPVAKKQDILLFGNGRYVGTFISSGVVLNPTKLDFGVGTEVADVAFHANQWWIALNSSISGTNRAQGQIYLYDGSTLQSQLADEVAVGVQRIGFIYPLNGIVYVAYQDVGGSFALGYISGRRILPLCFFTGSLPTFAQKTLYKGYLTFLSSGLVYMAGSAIPDLPYTLSQHADGGFTTVGAIAAPFGVPMIASTQSTSFKLAKFSGFDVNSTWKSLVMPTSSGRNVGYIDNVIVKTKNLGANASCSLTLEYNQGQTVSNAKTITTAGKRRHIFDKFNNPPGGIEDLRVVLDWSGGNATNDCAIKQIEIIGHYKAL